MSLKGIFVAIVLLHVSFAHAFTLNGIVADNKVKWDNLVTSHGVSTLSNWSPQSGLTPTERFRPGVLSTAPSTSMIELRNGVSSIQVALTLKGMEYNLGGNTIFSQSSANDSVCESINVTGNVISLQGRLDCRHDRIIAFDKSITPFYFLRPLFTIDDSAVLNAMKGKSEGRYIGQMPLKIRYFYYTKSGALTYRDLNQSFSIQLYFKPSYISSLNVTGNGVIPPSYNTTLKTVSGTTSFSVEAYGHFENGMRMRLPERSYRLSRVDHSSFIPYSITCIGTPCDFGTLVNNGTLINRESTLRSSGDLSRISFSLTMSYSNIAATTVESGTYTDEFNVLFEADF